MERTAGGDFGDDDNESSSSPPAVPLPNAIGLTDTPSYTHTWSAAPDSSQQFQPEQLCPDFTSSLHSASELRQNKNTQQNTFARMLYSFRQKAQQERGSQGSQGSQGVSSSSNLSGHSFIRELRPGA